MIGRMEISYENDDGEEVVVDLPSKKVVCSFCKGEGAHLCDGMRGVAFTQEDMADWEDDERAAYFEHGVRKGTKTPKSHYDVKCEECDGEKVVDEVDEVLLTAEEKVHYDLWVESEESRSSFDRAWAQERNMERMMGCG